jgi:hypothetical protein
MSIFEQIEELEEKGMWQAALLQLNRELEINPSNNYGGIAWNVSLL